MATVSKPYKASLSKTQGRQSYSIIFRHPSRKDPNTGKPGRRVRAGLGTKDENEAKQLVNQMNELLANSDYWTIGAQTTARGRYDGRIVDIFFHEIIPQPTDFMAVREQVISIPSSNDSDFRSALLLGTTGAGKTTLLRQIIGTHPTKDRFPSTSTAKTTVADTEIIVAEGDYQSVVTFMERDEVRDYLEECISKAVLTAYQRNSDSDVLKSLLQHVDQRMRFNYVLGNGSTAEDDFDEDEDEDDFDEVINSGESEFAPEVPDSLDLYRTNELLVRAVNCAREIAIKQGITLKTELDATEESDQRVIDELFEEELDRLLRQDEDYHAIADEIMDEIELRFSALTQGSLRKTKQGWPISWEYSSPDRNTFIKEILRFSSNYAPLFGTLLTPLVNGVRVKGPFFPAWTEDSKQPIVIVDGEGLGHTPDSSSSLSTNVLRRIDMVDAVVLVDNAAQPMQAAPVAALRSLVRTGNTKKLLICFTHFDEVKGDNLPKVSAKRDHVLASAENVMTRLGEDLGPNAERALRLRLAKHCFFLGGIDKVLDAETKRGKHTVEQIRSLLTSINQIVERPKPVTARPVYDRMNLVLAIREAADQFHEAWLPRLGLKYQSGINKEHWTRVKALSRRLANGWSDQYDNLRPVSDLHKQLGELIYVTIQEPIRWEGNDPDEDSQQQTYDDFSSTLTGRLLELAIRRVWTERSDEWQEAFNQYGKGSTFVRAKIIAEEIYDKAAPVPDLTPSPDRNKFLHEVLEVVEATCQELKITLE
ncbi:MAG: hypothetical protein ACRERU_14880 [Methylococcales bacterium]